MVTVTAVLASDVRKKAVLTVDPNDPLNRILVKAVEGLGLPSPDGFHLRYQRKILTDLSLPIRFAGFPPQAAQVDLVHANDLSIPELKQLASSSKSVLHASLSAESSVTLALQSPSLSNRLHSAVKVQATLWQVLLAFESASEGAFQAIKVGADTSIHAPEVIINNHKVHICRILLLMIIDFRFCPNNAVSSGRFGIDERVVLDAGNPSEKPDVNGRAFKADPSRPV